VVLLATVAGSPNRTQAEEGSSIAPATTRGSQAVRVYLSQSVTALGWARRYAESAGRSGQPDGFDLPRYLTELDTVIQGLERYLSPSGPARGPVTSVEITGQFLLEGLRSRDVRPVDQPRP
jgi:hypothetical protein